MTAQPTPGAGRDLEWEGCFNVRDLGGLPASGKHRIRPGALVRSDSIDHLTPTGWAALLAHGVTTVVDLRNDDERAADRSPRLPGLTTVHTALDDIDDVDFWAQMHHEDRTGSPLFYRRFLDRKPARAAAAVTAVARAAPGGVLLHCTAGRDRTGLVTVLLLAVAGVPAPEIADDNEAGTRRLPPLSATPTAHDHTPDPLRTPAEIQAILGRHHTTIGAEVTRLLAEIDVDAYLRSAGVTGADRHALRQRLLDSRPTRAVPVLPDGVGRV